MECIRFLAHQRLAFRGNDGNDNLTQLFKLLNINEHLEFDQHKYKHNESKMI